MTTQPEPRSVTEALGAALTAWLDSHGEADIEERLADAAKGWLAATPAPAPAVVPDVEAAPGLTWNDGDEPTPTVIHDLLDRWGAPRTHHDPYSGREVPLNVAGRLVGMLNPKNQEGWDWQARVRAEGRGALDVERVAAACLFVRTNDWDDLDVDVYIDKTEKTPEGRWAAYAMAQAERLVEADRRLAQREPAESQGPDGGLEQILAEQRAEDEATERQGEAEDAAGYDRCSPR